MAKLYFQKKRAEKFFLRIKLPQVIKKIFKWLKSKTEHITEMVVSLNSMGTICQLLSPSAALEFWYKLKTLELWLTIYVLWIGKWVSKFSFQKVVGFTTRLLGYKFERSCCLEIWAMCNYSHLLGKIFTTWALNFTPTAGWGKIQYDPSTSQGLWTWSLFMAALGRWVTSNFQMQHNLDWKLQGHAYSLNRKVYFSPERKASGGGDGITNGSAIFIQKVVKL